MKKLSIILMSLIISGTAAIAQTKSSGTAPLKKERNLEESGRTSGLVLGGQVSAAAKSTTPVTVNPVPAATQKGNSAKPIIKKKTSGGTTSVIDGISVTR